MRACVCVCVCAHSGSHSRICDGCSLCLNMKQEEERRRAELVSSDQRTELRSGSPAVFLFLLPTRSHDTTFWPCQCCLVTQSFSLFACSILSEHVHIWNQPLVMSQRELLVLDVQMHLWHFSRSSLSFESRFTLCRMNWSCADGGRVQAAGLYFTHWVSFAAGEWRLWPLSVFSLSLCLSGAFSLVSTCCQSSQRRGWYPARSAGPRWPLAFPPFGVLHPLLRWERQSRFLPGLHSCPRFQTPVSWWLWIFSFFFLWFFLFSFSFFSLTLFMQVLYIILYIRFVRQTCSTFDNKKENAQILACCSE